MSWQSSSGVEPVTSCQVALSVEPVTEQSSLMVAALAFPGRQGRGIDTKIGWRGEGGGYGTTSWNFLFLGSTATILLTSTDLPKAAFTSSGGMDWVWRPTWEADGGGHDRDTLSKSQPKHWALHSHNL